MHVKSTLTSECNGRTSVSAGTHSAVKATETRIPVAMWFMAWPKRCRARLKNLLSASSCFQCLSLAFLTSVLRLPTQCGLGYETCSGRNAVYENYESDAFPHLATMLRRRRKN